MSRYSNDTRVVLHPDGTATLPDEPGGKDGDWLVEHANGGGFTVRNTGDQGYVTEEGDRYNQWIKVFADCDAALAHMIGDPE